MKRKKAILPICEELESWLLLSAAPIQCILTDSGNLDVIGTSGRDSIVAVITAEPGADHVSVKLISRGVSKVFDGVKALNINTAAGNDVVVVSGTGLSYLAQGTWFSTYVSGGDGNDKVYVQTFDGNIFVDGGAGNDVIDASRMFANMPFIGQITPNVWLGGGDGNDVIRGSSGRDYLNGGAGNDKLYGGEGDDTLDGGTGRNLLNGGSGNDTFYVTALNGTYPNAVADHNTGGYDRIIGGAGKDTLYQIYNSALGSWKFGLVGKPASVEHIVLQDAASWYTNMG